MIDEQAEYLAEIQERTTNLLLQLTNSYFDLLAQTSQQKRVIAAQGSLISQCMERIMALEGRCILGNFNQRLEQLEANRGTYYAINKEQVSKMLEKAMERIDAMEERTHELELYQVGPAPELNCIRDRLDQLESWLYTHDYAYFQEEEENKTGNSSFEEHEMHNREVTYHEQAGNRLEDTTGTHPPNCRCAWCEPQEGVIEPPREDY